MNRLGDILVTEEYWFCTDTHYHVVFALSPRIAYEYLRAKGFILQQIEKPTKGLDKAVIIHSANNWFERCLLGYGELT